MLAINRARITAESSSNLGIVDPAMGATLAFAASNVQTTELLDSALKYTTAP